MSVAKLKHETQAAKICAKGITAPKCCAASNPVASRSCDSISFHGAEPFGDSIGCRMLGSLHSWSGAYDYTVWKRVRLGRTANPKLM